MIEAKKLQKILKQIPASPGIYKMIDENERVIYLGKAKDLSKRVRQYFQKNYQHSSRTKKLLEKLIDIKYTAVDTELEAEILEQNLIKQLQPKYNIIMKDDKNFVYIKITRKEDFPRIQIVRKIEKDGAQYIGPKSAAHKVKETFKVLKKIFPFRHCGLDIELTKANEKGDQEVKVSHKVLKYPCIDYFIKRCAAPCVGKCTKEEYAIIIKNIENFLSGHSEEIMNSLHEQMMQAARDRRFEKAAQLRNKIQKIEDILEKQKVADPNQEDKDIINYCTTHNRAYFNLFQIRDGKLIGQENFILNAEETAENSEDIEVLEAFLRQYYGLATDIPKEIIVPHELESQTSLENYISAQLQRKSRITVPQKGTKNKLLEMSLNNARIFADRNKPSWQEDSQINKNAAAELGKLLKIKTSLKRIECYDISHLSGTETVGSMIVFENGIPKNSHYRKFRLRTVIGKPDDYKSMEEVLYRRFNKLAQKNIYRDYVFRRATKKDDSEIQKEAKKAGVNRNKQDYKAFHVLEKVRGKRKTLAAFGKIAQLSPKASGIFSLSVLPKERGQKLGYKLLSELIKKSKTKRVYLICRQQLKDYYLTFGFEEIKKVPSEMEDTMNHCKKDYQSQPLTLAIDKIKLKEDESFGKTPDLAVIDGGKGQLTVAKKVFAELQLDIPHISIAKQLEEIFVPGRSNSIILERNNEALKLLQRARDEAHRFAISYNRQLRSKNFS